jgi:hypothetical protein
MKLTRKKRLKSVVGWYLMKAYILRLLAKPCITLCIQLVRHREHLFIGTSSIILRTRHHWTHSNQISEKKGVTDRHLIK